MLEQNSPGPPLHPAAPAPEAWKHHDAPGHPRRPRGARPGEIDWPSRLRTLERQRRLLQRGVEQPRRADLAEHFAHATFCSFLLEGLQVSQAEVLATLETTPQQRTLRSRQALRIRNHVSILRHIENALLAGEPLCAGGVVRWYTSISCGLCTAALDGPSVARLEQIVRQINSPQLRLQPALQEIAALHSTLLSDPLVPGFNGILARLLLRYHLGRCSLPGVVIPADIPPATLRQAERFVPILLELLDGRFAELLAE
ncbi:MAG TPA: hypothetical protein VIL86_20320 [Tepidisphaeraceae bacterium]|jgi:hypothetical protein